uniref:Disease resistance R13L4/SHOC-2-like LRR domain-containing protein n=1 Tax=Oryza glaberrima TaxID=4538 RepID=I1R320_ORYGL
MWAGSAKGVRAAMAAPPSSPSTAKAFQQQQLHTHGQHRGSSAPSPPHRTPEPVAPVWHLRPHGSTRATVNSWQRWDGWLQTHSGSGEINDEIHNLNTACIHYLCHGGGGGKSNRRIGVFKESVNLDQEDLELIEEAKLILKKCKGLPLAIVTIGGFLASRPKTALEWRKLNEHISAELETNPELEAIRAVLNISYDGLPYHLKSCFLYLSIFPEDDKISRKRLVHDIMREIAISKSKEENLVLRLEGGRRLHNHDTVRHLSITNSSEDRETDVGELKTTVDMSRIRSLTVFGEWRPFFISDKMRLLRVLDLEDTEGVRNHHIKQIGELLHLRYLSLRGCMHIAYLPDSLGNLRQLETLDVKDTFILRLPKTITNLRKLKYLRASIILNVNEVITEELPEKNSKKFLSALAALSRLESLSLISKGKPGLWGCLDAEEKFSPPKDLKSLKLHGNLVELPKWIGKLNNLVKLKLSETGLKDHDAAIQVLGKLRNLTILCLPHKSFHSLEGGELNFSEGSFKSLVVLELDFSGSKCVKFQQGAFHNLELLKLPGYIEEVETKFSGLEFLPRIKEVRLRGLLYNEYEQAARRLKEDLL